MKLEIPAMVAGVYTEDWSPIKTTEKSVGLGSNICSLPHTKYSKYSLVATDCRTK
jgi:hypothetical protein